MAANVPDGFSLEGKKAAIAVGRSGWGAVIAGALAEAGADVAVIGLDRKELAATAGAAKAQGREGNEYPTDPTKELDVRRAVKQILRDFGRLDILVNNAGVEFFKPATSITNREFQALVDQNIKTAFLLCREAGRVMVEQQQGRIVNIVSGLAERGVWNGSAYCASQAAVLAMTRALGLEWARQGVRVNAVGTGWYSVEAPVQGEDRDLLTRYIPLRRKGHPEDISAAVVYLASDACEYLAGTCIHVDGGLLAHP